MWPRSFHPSSDVREDEVGKFAQARHEALSKLGSNTAAGVASQLPGLKLLDTVQCCLDAAHPGASRLMTQANQCEDERVRLLKQHTDKSGLADQFAAAVAIVDKACSSPLAMLGKKEIEGLKD